MPDICITHGCGREVHAKGLCRACYQLEWRDRHPEYKGETKRRTRAQRSRRQFVRKIDEDRLRRLKEAYNAPGGGVMTRVALKREIRELETLRKGSKL